MLGSDRVNILESILDVSLASRDKGGVVERLRFEGFESLVGLGSSCLELLTGSIDV